MNVSTQNRWIQARLTAAKTLEHQMPWERGARRLAFIARRRASLTPTQAQQHATTNLQTA